MIKKINILLILLSISLYSMDVNSLFNLSGNGEIIYYNSDNVDSKDYIIADKIKENLSKSGYKIYSAIIADILDFDSGNEFIFLVAGNIGDSIFIYNSNMAKKFSYQTDRIGNNAALDLESFFDKKSEIKIIKYYVLNTNGKDRDIYMYLFRLDNDKINFLTDISFYREINSKKSSVIHQIDNVFVDIDEDGIYEMLVESKEKVSGRKDRVEYQVYKLNKNMGRYECVMSSWLEDDLDINMSRYFKKD